jgi:hypothetical protein
MALSSQAELPHSLRVDRIAQQILEPLVPVSVNPIGEIGFGYFNVYDNNKLMLPIIRQKMALSDV